MQVVVNKLLKEATELFIGIIAYELSILGTCVGHTS